MTTTERNWKLEYGTAVLARREDETVKQWQVRLILEKLVNGLDIDWFELSRLEGFDCTPDHLRRIGKGVELVYDAGLLASEPRDAAVSPDDSGLESIRIEKQKMWDLRREVNEHYRATARDELLRESVCAAARELPPIMFAPPAFQGTTRSDKVLVVPIADIHYGREISVAGLKGETLNVYSPEVFEQRMSSLFAQIIELLQADEYDELIGIQWIARSGAAWRDMPERYGPWQTAYKRFVQWQESGLLERIFHELGEDADLEDISIDSTCIKAHKASAGAQRGGRLSAKTGKNPRKHNVSASVAAAEVQKSMRRWMPWAIPFLCS